MWHVQRASRCSRVIVLSPANTQLVRNVSVPLASASPVVFDLFSVSRDAQTAFVDKHLLQVRLYPHRHVFTKGFNHFKQTLFIMNIRSMYGPGSNH